MKPRRQRHLRLVSSWTESTRTDEGTTAAEVLPASDEAVISSEPIADEESDDVDTLAEPTPDHTSHRAESRAGPRRRSRKVRRQKRVPLRPVVGEDGKAVSPRRYGATYNNSDTQMVNLPGSVDITEEVTTAQPIPKNISVEEAKIINQQLPADVYDLVHPSPKDQPLHRVMRNGWLRATLVEKASGLATKGHELFNRAMGAVGLSGVISRANTYPASGYHGDSGDVEGIAHPEYHPNQPTAIVSEAQLETPDVAPATEGAPRTAEFPSPHSQQDATTQAEVYADAAAERDEADPSRPQRTRDAWRDFETILDSGEGSPADLVNSARHILEVSGYNANTARKLAQDIMYYANGPEAKAFVEEIAQGRIETVSENPDDVRRELHTIAERTIPLPRLTANVAIPKREVTVAADGSIKFPKTFPQVRDMEREARQPSESGMQNLALKALEKGDFSGYQHLPEPVKAELEKRQLRPGEANAANRELVAQISLWGARFVEPDRIGIPSESTQNQTSELASV